MQSIVRVKVSISGQEYYTVSQIRSISKMFLVEFNMKPICAIGLCYGKVSPEKHYYVDLEVNEEQKAQLEAGIMANNCHITTVEMRKNLLRDSTHSLFESYYTDRKNVSYSSPYSAGEAGLYRDEYSNLVSYTELLEAK